MAAPYSMDLRERVAKAWDQSGDFGSVAEWDRHVGQWAQRIKSPLRIEVK